MLKAEGISKHYQTPANRIEILSGVDLTLNRGEAAAIMGPSGSGKSTLLYILGALDPPSAGSVTIDGQDYGNMPEREQAAFRNQRIGFVFQDHALLPQCTAFENVLVPTLIGEEDPSAAESARRLLKHVGLEHRLEHKPDQLSGGEKQRVAIARSLIRKPVLLLCDEPTGNLDRASADGVADVLLDLHREQQTILVIVTHSQELASRFPIQFQLLERRLQRV